MAIAAHPKGEGNSWPHWMEYELKEYLRTNGTADGVEKGYVLCNSTGCLLYVQGDHFRGGSIAANALIERLRTQTWIHEFENTVDRYDRSEQPPGTWYFSNQKPWSVLVIFKRKGLEGPPRTEQSKG